MSVLAFASQTAADLQDKLLEELAKDDQPENKTLKASRFVQVVDQLGVAIADKMDDDAALVEQITHNLGKQNLQGKYMVYT